MFPRPEVSADGLSLRHNGRTDVPPLIKIGSFSASAGLFGLIGSPLRLRTVELDRMEITIPPGGLRDRARPAGAAPKAEAEAGDSPPEPSNGLAS